MFYFMFLSFIIFHSMPPFHILYFGSQSHAFNSFPSHPLCTHVSPVTSVCPCPTPVSFCIVHVIELFGDWRFLVSKDFLLTSHVSCFNSSLLICILIHSLIVCSHMPLITMTNHSSLILNLYLLLTFMWCLFRIHVTNVLMFFSTFLAFL